MFASVEHCCLISTVKPFNSLFTQTGLRSFLAYNNSVRNEIVNDTIVDFRKHDCTCLRVDHSDYF